MRKSQRRTRRDRRGAPRRTKNQSARRRAARRRKNRTARRRAALRKKGRTARRRAARQTKSRSARRRTARLAKKRRARLYRARLERLSGEWFAHHCTVLRLPDRYYDDDADPAEFKPSWRERIRLAVDEAKPEWLDRLLRKIDDARWWIRCRLDPRRRLHVVPTGLKPGCYGADMRILHASFELLRRWYEKVSPMIPWDDPDLPAHYATLRELYVWWTQERAAEIAAMDEVIERSGNPIELQERGIPTDPWESVAIVAMQEELEEKEDTQLARLALLRRHLILP